MTSTDTQSAGLAVSVRDLRKSYGEIEAVGGISFEVTRGEVFCLLGPNGAGKTTTVEILEGYRTADAGDVRVLGMDPTDGERALRERVGIVLQQCGVQRDLTVAELIEMYGRYHARRRPVDDVLELVELTQNRDVQAKHLSGGQRRRLDLALALVGDPDLIFLDEPTTGFDPAARRQAWSTIRSICELGKTVFLTTHYMDEAQYLGQPTLDGELEGARMALSAAGITADVQRSEVTLDPEVEAVLAWAVREGATNVIRHSGARRCMIEIGASSQEAAVEVLDDGQGTAAGNGLAAEALSQGESPLTPREREVLVAARQHATVADLAGALYLSPGTVGNHLSSVMQKLDARNRAEALRVAEERGWL